MKKIVTIGGGTGSYTILSGLKNIPDVSLTALVSMADNGGSTGILRDELGVLPPGDVRQCLVALSEHTDIVRKLMSYRFNEGKLSGHSFGNIFLAALEKVTGNFAQGVEIASEILKVKGSVVPITKNKAELSVILKNRTLIEGQVNITKANLYNIGIKKIFYKKSVKINKDARNAILKADFIIIGPGDYYCSIIPNILVEGFKETLTKSKAKIILPVNLTNKQGHTKNWKVSDYVKNIEMYLGKDIDIILINNEAPSKEQVERYKLKEGNNVLIKDDLNDKRIIRTPLISHSIFAHNNGDVLQNIRSFIIHDSSKIANCINNIIQNHAKFIFDFDDVLFNNTKQFKKHMFSSIEEAGVPLPTALNYYKKVRKDQFPFSLKKFISKLFIKQKKFSKKLEKDLYQKIMKECKNFTNTELLEIVKKMGKTNCYMVTNGDKDFQKDKIKRSNISQLFCEIHIVPESKKNVIEKICDKNRQGEIIFTDNRKIFIDDIDFKNCPNLKTIHYDIENPKKGIEEISKAL